MILLSSIIWCVCVCFTFCHKMWISSQSEFSCVWHICPMSNIKKKWCESSFYIYFCNACSNWVMEPHRCWRRVLFLSLARSGSAEWEEQREGGRESQNSLTIWYGFDAMLTICKIYALAKWTTLPANMDETLHFFLPVLLSIFSTLCYGILVLAMCTKSAAVAATTAAANTHRKPSGDGSNEAWQNEKQKKNAKNFAKYWMASAIFYSSYSFGLCMCTALNTRSDSIGLMKRIAHTSLR